jgi:hypothetical protein
MVLTEIQSKLNEATRIAEAANPARWPEGSLRR